jgi:hypothetical protein
MAGYSGGEEPRNKDLEICAQLSAQIERSESIVEAKRQASGSPEALLER